MRKPEGLPYSKEIAVVGQGHDPAKRGFSLANILLAIMQSGVRPFDK